MAAMKKELCSKKPELDVFDQAQRLAALRRLAAQPGWRPPAEALLANMHMHSFFSYNIQGCSPAHLAWDAARAGLFAAGLCDFDVLDGLDEFLAAGRLLSLRATVNIETRAYFPEYAEADINSPGEPGVAYIMGAGFVRLPAPGSPPGVVLQQYREQAQARNRALVNRINAAVPAIALDYDAEILPLTPAGAPTERHIVRAYRRKAEAAFPAAPANHRFWADLSKKPVDAIARHAAAEAPMEEFIRALLVKAGGLGYEQPGPHTFPPLDDFIRWVRECDALPMIAWLDGGSAAEADPEAMLECMRAKGVCAVNIIPDRNHKIADPAVRARKLAKLDEIAKLADRMHLPVQIGTEMNKDGQPFVDDLAAEALRPYADQFLAGAAIMVGHTILAGYANYPYNGTAAAAEFGNNPAARNRLFQSVGRLPALDEPLADRLRQTGPARACAVIRDSAKKGAWQI